MSEFYQMRLEAAEMVAEQRIRDAAPDMLDALKVLLEVYDAMGAGQSYPATKARAAIAKAEGRAS